LASGASLTVQPLWNLQRPANRAHLPTIQNPDCTESLSAFTSDTAENVNGFENAFITAF